MGFFNDLSLRAMGLGSEMRYPAALKSDSAPKGAISQRYGWTGHNTPMPDPFNGQELLTRAYEAHVYVFRCVDSIANSIVSQPFRAGDPVSFNYKITNPLARLLGPAPGGPNPMMSSADLLRHAIASYMLLGKFAWAIERDYVGRIVGLWPLRAQDIRPVANDTGRGTDYFKWFVYNQGMGNETIYYPDEIVYIYKKSLNDFLQPESPARVASLNINISKMLDQFDYNFLKNGGVPANLIITPRFAKDEDRRSFQEQFISDFTGVGNAGRTLFAERELEEGDEGAMESVQVETLGITQRDAETNILAKREIMAICLAFGVPLSILGDSTAVTFSNAFQDRRNYWLETLEPRAREISDGLNMQLAPLLGKEVGWFDLRGVPELRAEPAIDAQYAEDWIRSGIVKLDEVRADRGLPPAKEVGLSGVIAEVEPVQVGEAPANSLQKEAGAKVVPPAKAPVASAPAASRAQASHTSDADVRANRELSKSLDTLLSEQRDNAIQRVSSRRGKKAFDIDYWMGRTTELLTPSLQSILPTPKISDLIRQVTAQTAHLMADVTTQEQVDEVLQSRKAAIADLIIRTKSQRQVLNSRVEQAIYAVSTGEVGLDDALSLLED